MTKCLSAAQIFMDSKNICQMNKIDVTSSKYVISQVRVRLGCFGFLPFPFFAHFIIPSLSQPVFGTLTAGL